jgi:hypothetical protein
MTSLASITAKKKPQISPQEFKKISVHFVTVILFENCQIFALKEMAFFLDRV